MKNDLDKSTTKCYYNKTPTIIQNRLKHSLSVVELPIECNGHYKVYKVGATCVIKKALDLSLIYVIGNNFMYLLLH